MKYALLAAKRVLYPADGVLHLAGDLVRLSFRFQLGVAGDLAGDFLDGALGLLSRAFDPILVHVCAFQCVLAGSTPVTLGSSVQDRPLVRRARPSAGPGKPARSVRPKISALCFTSNSDVRHGRETGGWPGSSRH